MPISADVVRLLFSFFSCVVMAGCTTAQMIAPVGAQSSTPYAPVNEAARSGLIKYLNGGAETVVKQRREDAYKQMHTACNGKYRIDAEGPREEGGTVVVEPSKLTAGAVTASSYSFDYWYIQFSCVR